MRQLTKTGSFAVAALLLAARVLAAPPNAANTTPPPPALNVQLHNFTLRNRATKAIEHATAKMTTGATADVTAKGKIMPNESQSFAANNSGCIDSISVTFTGGATLRSQHLNACTVTTINVDDSKIYFSTSARPGADSPSEPSNR